MPPQQGYTYSPPGIPSPTQPPNEQHVLKIGAAIVVIIALAVAIYYVIPMSNKGSPAVTQNDIVTFVNGTQAVRYAITKDGVSVLALPKGVTGNVAWVTRLDGMGAYGSLASSGGPEAVPKGSPPPLGGPVILPPSWSAVVVAKGATQGKSIGEGLPLGFANDGSLIVMSSKGVEAVGLTTHLRRTSITMASPPFAAALSSDSLNLAILNPVTNLVDLYTYGGSNGTIVPVYTGSFKTFSPVQGLSYDSANILFALGSSTLEAYVFKPGSTAFASTSRFDLTQ